WSQLETAATLSPSSLGLQPWKFVGVTDAAVRTKLREFAWNQPQITDASHLVVFCVKKGMNAADADRMVAATAATRNVPVESLDGLKAMAHGALTRLPADQIDPWMSRQVFIALGVFLASAAMVGVDACPMEGFQPEKFDEILGLTAKGYGSVVLATAGYRAADDKYATAAKVRFPVDELVERV
ncbi:MAG: NAD(P)H-dependent oxidoreductase, partial [Fimbriiglobus sp.]